jgi:hypothetical protein
MKLPLWVEVDGKWEVFPYDRLTAFPDGEMGFTYGQLLDMPRHSKVNCWHIYKKYMSHFRLDEPNSRVILGPKDSQRNYEYISDMWSLVTGE